MLPADGLPAIAQHEAEVEHAIALFLEALDRVGQPPAP